VNPLGADTDDEINQKVNHCCNKVEIQFTIGLVGEFRPEIITGLQLGKERVLEERQKTSAG